MNRNEVNDFLKQCSSEVFLETFLCDAKDIKFIFDTNKVFQGAIIEYTKDGIDLIINTDEQTVSVVDGESLSGKVFSDIDPDIVNKLADMVKFKYGYVENID